MKIEDFNPDAPGVAEVTQGISTLIKDKYPDIEGLLRQVAYIFEHRHGRLAMVSILIGVRKMHKNDIKPEWVLRFMAEVVERDYQPAAPAGEEAPIEDDNIIEVDFKSRERIT